MNARPENSPGAAKTRAHPRPKAHILVDLKIAVSSLAVFWQRAALALIGIVVGIGSVIVMVSVGTIVKNQIYQQFLDMGTDVLTVRGTGSGGEATSRPDFSPEIAKRLVRLPAIEVVAPYIRVSQELRSGGKALSEEVELVGTTQSFAGLNKLKVVHGRFLSELDYRRPYCVLGAQVAEELGGADPEALLGTFVKVADAVYTVVGVLQAAPKTQRVYDVNRAVFVPLSTAQRALGVSDIRETLVRIRHGVHYTVAIEQIEQYFARVAPRQRIRVRSPEALIEKMFKQMKMLSLLLGTAGAISLLIGSVGVMNVMLLSVSNRQAEIGIRRALGALRRDIRWQFLFEALILSTLGGVLGTVLGLVASYLFSSWIGWTFVFSWVAVVLGIAITFAVGLASGYYPAYLAARMNPIQALNSR